MAILGSVTGTISGGGTKITGSGTAFTTELEVGDIISVASKGWRKVVNIESNTILTVDQAFPSSLSGASATYHKHVGFSNFMQGQWVSDGTSDIWMWIEPSGLTFYMNEPRKDTGWLVVPASTIVPIAT